MLPMFGVPQALQQSLLACELQLVALAPFYWHSILINAGSLKLLSYAMCMLHPAAMATGGGRSVEVPTIPDWPFSSTPGLMLPWCLPLVAGEDAACAERLPQVCLPPLQG